MPSGEFTCPSWKDFTADMLAPLDVSVDSHTSPLYVTIVLRCSKNDPFAIGIAASGQNGGGGGILDVS